MRVLFATTRLSGGAGTACRRIWESFREQNKVEVATIVYREKTDLRAKQYIKSTGKTVTLEIYNHHSQWADENLSKLVNEERSSFSATYLSALELEGPYDQYLIDLIDAHDIVNMHWTSGLFTIKSLEHLRNTNTPVIITLHDQNHLTGACHYSGGCRLFTGLCSNCPQLSTESAKLIAKQQHQIKHTIFGCNSFYWTGPSEWIVDEAARSGMPCSPKHLLPSLKNPIADEAACTPNETERIAKLFQSGKLKVALIADDLNDTRKGIVIGVKALAMAARISKHLEQEIELHLVGSADGCEILIKELINQTICRKSGKPTINVISHGRVPTNQLAVILRLVDLLVFPSIEENYSNLLIEAIGEGTPIAAFAVGGNSELAKNYPKLMKAAGLKLDISNGINPNETSKLKQCIILLCNTILDQLESNNNAENANAESQKCKLRHSQHQVANEYLLAMQSVLASNQLSSTTRIRQPLPETKTKSHRGNLKLKTNHHQVVNKNEPVFWLGTKNDWPIEVGKNEALLTLVLKPSWEPEFISKKLEFRHWSWIEHPIYNHDRHQLPDLRYWDLVALVATSSGQDNCYPSHLLLPTAETENALPLLLQTVIRISDHSSFLLKNMQELIWECIRGECIVSPMQGLKHYPHKENFDQAISVTNTINASQNKRAHISLSSIIGSIINTQEPVFWLGRNTFNDLTSNLNQALYGIGMYPSWETNYLEKIFSREASYQILHEVLYTQSEIPELRYWNTIVLKISTPIACHIFTEEADENHTLPLLYMGYGEQNQFNSEPTLTELILYSEKLITVIPRMAGFRQISSTLD
ncbi:MAG: glycosyltransferase [Synechococcaceae cyanobacterium ELA445]